MIKEGHEIIQSPLPAVSTVTKEINVPRLPSLRGIMKSKSAPIPIWNIEDLSVDEERVGLSGSFTKVIKIFFPQRSHRAEILEGDRPVRTEYMEKAGAKVPSRITTGS